MSRIFYFITHPEVVIDPLVPVPRWPLSTRGRARMESAGRHAWVRELTAIYCSDEQKAIDGAGILSRLAGVPYEMIATLGENDRSATGYLPPAEFEATADAFFSRPDQSIRGWERAVDAQARVVRTITDLATRAPGAGAIGIVSHGGVGGLLLCHVKGCPIARSEDQPGRGGGNYFVFSIPGPTLLHGWRPIDG